MHPDNTSGKRDVSRQELEGEQEPSENRMDRRHFTKATALGTLGIATGLTGIAGNATAASCSGGIQTVASDAYGSNRRPNTFGLYDSAVDTSFVSYMGPNSDPHVLSYDHGNGTWSSPKTISASVSTDSHNYPMMLQSDDDRIQLFYSEHNQMLYHATSPNASSISGTWSESQISEGAYATYPVPVKASNGDVFVFYRETTQNDPNSSRETDYRPLQYVRSTDDGQTWSDNETLTGLEPAIGHTRSDNLNEIYLGQIRREPAHDGQPERFHLVWTLAGGGSEGHEHDRYHEDVYHAYFVPSDLEFYGMDGTNVGHHVGESDSENHCKVYDTGEPTNPETADDPFDIGYRQVVHYTDAGDPVVVYEHNSMGLVASRWTGSGWSHNSSDLAGGGIGDIERVGPQSFRFYAYDADTLRVFETTDAGANWSQVDTITYPTNLHYTHNVVPNYKDPVKIVSLEDGGGNVYVGTEQSSTDSTPPSAPTNLRVNDVTEMTVDVEWDAASDNETSVQKYNVYIDGTQERVSTDLREVAKQLTPDTQYDFHVTALDCAGNESAPSNTVTVTTENDATAYYSLDTDTATDESDNRNDGTNHEAGTGATGVTGSCWNFDGDDDYVDCPVDVLEGAEAYSVSLWIQSDQTGDDRTFVSFDANGQFGIGNASSGQYTSNTDLIQVRHENANGATSYAETESNVHSSSFQHVAVTFSSANGFEVYLDGSQLSIDAEQNNGGELSLAQLRLADRNSLGENWDGKLDEIRFYQRELSASEVDTLHQQDS